MRDLPGRSHILIEEGADPCIESFRHDLLLVEWANQAPFRGTRRLSKHDLIKDAPLCTAGTSQVDRDLVEVSCDVTSGAT